MDDLPDIAPRQCLASRLEETTYYRLFDWLRFALALIVFLAHAQILTWEKTGNLAVRGAHSRRILRQGYFGYGLPWGNAGFGLLPARGHQSCMALPVNT